MNNNILLISGKSSTGKSMSLMGLKEPEGVMYLNCEGNKSLPFRNKFNCYTITDPLQVVEAIDKAENMANIHTIVIDSLTYMMDMFETVYVLTAANRMAAWGDYCQFFKKMMSQNVAMSTKRIIFTAHTMDVLNESEMINETLVKVKGSLMNTGIESMFCTVLSTKKVPLNKLADQKSNLLVITDKEKKREYKYVFQTSLTKETVNERIRSPIDMWDDDETYIDNNVQNVLDRIQKYYK